MGRSFGALFYARMISVPWLGGADNNAMTHEVLWPAFEAIWPLTTTPGGTTTEAMPWTGLPLQNTVILLLSSITLHMAHVSLEKNKRTALIVWLEITIVLAAFFLYYQAVEYAHAYQDMGLTSNRYLRQYLLHAHWLPWSSCIYRDSVLNRPSISNSERPLHP
ncbi:cytochrome c oxidase polypeptide III [Vibrio variabilis]|uniref:cytochrome-c oxidase n=1 Tax=Vibrio variabilis TaxID=990271 RepID=A0ABQ0JH57_9VIBR|nr:cytochrome c oxidase polypeptide III [Vibrio variabilis]